jgi:hypothetical protein
MSHAIVIDINSSFQSFDLVRKYAGNYLEYESSQNFLDDLKKFIDFGNRSRSELILQPIKETKSDEMGWQKS